MQDGVRLNSQFSRKETSDELLWAFELLMLRVWMLKRQPLMTDKYDVVFVFTFLEETVCKKVLVWAPFFHHK